MFKNIIIVLLSLTTMKAIAESVSKDSTFQTHATRNSSDQSKLNQSKLSQSVVATTKVCDSYVKKIELNRILDDKRDGSDAHMDAIVIFSNGKSVRVAPPSGYWWYEGAGAWQVGTILSDVMPLIIASNLNQKKVCYEIGTRLVSEPYETLKSISLE